MKKTRVIIDCDTGIDDMMALTYAVHAPELEILGVTTVCGNLPVAITTYNTLQVLHLLGCDEIPVARGADRPLCRELYDAANIHGTNGLGGYIFQNPTQRTPVEESAWDFIYRILNEQSEPIDIIAIAPLTNIARLLKKYPDAKKKIRRIVFMGGSLRTGNPTPVATFNVLVDPEAAKYVIATKIPFVMCSLDCTRGSYLTIREIEEIHALHNSVSEMIYEALHFYISSTKNENTVDARKKESGVNVHDLCTVMFVTHPELFEGQYYFADVETKGELTTGFTLVDYEDNLRKPACDKTVFFLRQVDRQAYVRYYLDLLSQY